MRKILVTSLFPLLLAAGCASQPPSAEAVAALTAELAAPKVAVDTDCIFSAPVKNAFIAYRHFGLCLFSGTQLRLYYRGQKPALAFDWRLAAIKSYALHGKVFTLVTDAGNFGLVVEDAPGLVAALRAQRVSENPKLPEFRSKDLAPWFWM